MRAGGVDDEGGSEFEVEWTVNSVLLSPEDASQVLRHLEKWCPHQWICTMVCPHQSLLADCECSDKWARVCLGRWGCAWVSGRVRVLG
jgi:hypothetical protein